jgi:translocator assembly and maintenance protein 41
MTEPPTGTPGALTSSQTLAELIDQTFPQNQLLFAFGYGSGVFSQALQGDDPRQAGMLDLILVVQDAQAFHWANEHENPTHYAGWIRTLDYCQGQLAAGLQRRFLQGKDAKVLFHVVDDADDGPPLKYGVIQYEDFVQDLTQWESLYIAGRLHKPTLPIPILSKVLQEEELSYQKILQEAQTTNLQAAVAASLLMAPLPSPADSTTTNSTPNLLSWTDFYSKIAALSYTGDFRMQVGGEDPQKIQKLVQAPGQLERFHLLYRGDDYDVDNNATSSTMDDNTSSSYSLTSGNSILKPLESSGLISIGSKGLEWDPYDIAARTQLIKRLPMVAKKPLLVPSTTTSRQGSSNPVQNHLTQQQESLAKVLTSIVAPAAKYQSFKGLFTLGVRKSIRYASAKLSKGLFRKR